MKILKVFLLTFVISFTVNTVNAQCDDPIGMTVIPITGYTFDVTVYSPEPRILAIFIEGENEGFVAEHPVTQFNATVSFAPEDYSPGKYLIHCGMKRSFFNKECYEGCTVDVDN